MLRASYKELRLKFKEPATTSRTVMTEKRTYLLELYDTRRPEIKGVGECALFEGLSEEDGPEYEDYLKRLCEDPYAGPPQVSSIIFGYESAQTDLAVRLGDMADPSCCVTTNGLIWMGDKRTMRSRIRQKLESGFKCLKLKIGGINFEDELDLLRMIREEFDESLLEIRLDANGSMTPENALERLGCLSQYAIHSIEQPIRPKQFEAMAEICSRSPIAVALDEELIGMWPDDEARHDMLKYVAPSYIILKPSLCGGFESADRWINLAQSLSIGWWATSALESNVGLTAIMRWLRKYSPEMPQGLGTGLLYENNIDAPLHLVGEKLYYHGI